MSFWFNKIKGLWHRMIEEDVLCLSQAFQVHMWVCALTLACNTHVHRQPIWAQIILWQFYFMTGKFSTAGKNHNNGMWVGGNPGLMSAICFQK